MTIQVGYAQNQKNMDDAAEQIDLIEFKEKNELEVQDLVAQGTAFLEKNEYDKAILIFEQALSQAPTVTIALMIAKLYSKQMVNCQQAILAWENAIDICRKQSCDLLADIVDRKKQYVQKCGPVILLESNVPSDLFENQKHLGSTPLEIRLLYGSHFIEFQPKNQQYESKNLRLSISEFLNHQRFMVELEKKSIFKSIFSSNSDQHPKLDDDQNAKAIHPETIFLFFDNTEKFSNHAKIFTLVTASTFSILGGLSYFVSIQKNNNALSLYQQGQAEIDANPDAQESTLNHYQNAIDRAESQSHLYEKLSYVALSIGTIALISRIYLSVKPPRKDQNQSVKNHAFDRAFDRTFGHTFDSKTYDLSTHHDAFRLQFGINHFGFSF